MTNGADSQSQNIIIRTHRYGDLGMIVHRHGLVYFEDLNWTDPMFEGHVARIAADFLLNYDPSRERCWIAERRKESEGKEESRFLGSIMLIKDPDREGTAKLRVFFVEKEARGLGIGKRLLQTSVNFAREAGYQRIVLRTESTLLAARGLYKKQGFVKGEGVPHRTFDFEERVEEWELVL